MTTMASAGMRPDQATKVLERKLVRDPNDAEARLQLGAIQYLTGQERKALETFALLPEASAHFAIAGVYRALCQLALERRDDAIRELNAALAAAPGLFSRHDANSGHDSASDINFFRHFFGLVGRRTGPINKIGTMLKDLERLQEAEACFRIELEHNVRSAKVWSNLGTVLKEQRKIEDAISCHRKAVALSPKDAEALNNLGATLLKRKGREQEAIGVLADALKLRPGYHIAHSNLGIAWKKAGRIDKAVESCRESASLLNFTTGGTISARR